MRNGMRGGAVVDAVKVLETAPPWLHVADGGGALDRLWAGAQAVGGFTRVLRGRRMHTQAEVFAEFSRALQFPAGTTSDWDGLISGLRDLAWLPDAPSYLLLLENAHWLLDDEPPERLAEFAAVLADAAAWWSEPAPVEGGGGTRDPVPFHVVLLTSTTWRSRAIAARWAGAGVAVTPLADGHPLTG
jgi:hypothetical protein